VNPVPPVSGNDATVAGLQLIIAGDQYNTISKPSEIVGGAAADVADKLLKGETPEPKTTIFGSPAELFTPTLVTQENLKTEIIDKNITPASELCTAEYAAACARLGLT
jgi:D-xylose transport system substrate-binding protein